MDNVEQRFVPTSLAQMVITEDGGAVILALQRDLFLGLDQTATMMWELLAEGRTPREVVLHLREQYTNVSDEQLHRDVALFIQNMEEKHLLLSANSPLITLKRQVSQRSSFLLLQGWSAIVFPLLSVMPLFTVHREWLEAWLTLQWVDASLQNGGFMYLTQKLEAMPAWKTVLFENPDVRRLARRVEAAAAWQPFKAVCLHQCLALGLLLRRRSIQADLVIGVSKFPFFAHAWLKSGHDVILHAIHWEIGLGLDKSIQRLQNLSVLFCTGRTAKTMSSEVM